MSRDGTELVMKDDFNDLNIKMIPLVSLRDITIFPFMVVPLFIGRNKSIKAVEETIMKDKILMLATQRLAITEEPETADIFSVGTAAEILQMVKLPDGTIKVLLEGRTRAKIIRYVQTEPCFIVEVEQIPESFEVNNQIEALMRNVLIKFEKYIKLTRTLPPEAFTTASSIQDPCRFADLIASQLVLKVDEKQSIIEAFDATERLERLDIILEHELEILEIQKNIQSTVRKRMEKAQKEYYLKEQLRAIHKELGEEEEERTEEVEEFYKKIKEAKLPEDVAEKANAEVKRLAKMPPGSAEAVVVRNYLDWIISLPWNKKTKETLELKKVEKILEEDHYGLEKVKERIVEYLAVRKLKGKKKGAILCFVGPPGVGKTSLGKSIARALNRKYARVSLGGVRDEAEIRGHRRTYVGALPGRIIQTMKKAGTRNPVFLMDEVDKMSTDFRGDPSAALLEVLDPEQNREFSDHYLEVPFDLSDVMFITTANMIHPIPPPLVDRMEVLELPGYTEIEKEHIARLFLIPKIADDHGLKRTKISLSDGSLEEIIRRYTREAGVRNLEREVSTIFRKIAKESVLEKRKEKWEITKTCLKKFLGVPKFRYGLVAEKDEVGVAIGLAWTPSGGDILTIEVSLMKGKGKLNLTGQLGEVMQESAQAALTFARSKTKELHISSDFYQKFDIHIHVPEGGIPKDGPSAGITLATALISALLEKPVDRNVAMTGEITLRGNILPVGGVKEKVLAAHRAGIKTVILPEENRKDFKEIPYTVRRKLDIRFIQRMEDVLEIALKK